VEPTFRHARSMVLIIEAVGSVYRPVSPGVYYREGSINKIGAYIANFRDMNGVAINV
jgi:hypothetical protein